MPKSYNIKDIIISQDVPVTTYNNKGEKNITYRFGIKFLLDDNTMSPIKKMWAEEEFINDLKKTFPDASVVRYGGEKILFDGVVKNYCCLVILGFTEGDAAYVQFYAMAGLLDKLIDNEILPNKSTA